MNLSPWRGAWRDLLAEPELLPLIDALGRVLLGKEHQVRLAFTCLLAGGHLLIEDRPGMGKSTLAEALARLNWQLGSVLGVTPWLHQSCCH